jgi:hypothetical protein
MKTFLVVCPNLPKFNIRSSDFYVGDQGDLVFFNEPPDLPEKRIRESVMAFAPGVWLYVETVNEQVSRTKIS